MFWVSQVAAYLVPRVRTIVARNGEPIYILPCLPQAAAFVFLHWIANKGDIVSKQLMHMRLSIWCLTHVQAVRSTSST